MTDRRADFYLFPNKRLEHDTRRVIQAGF